MRAALFAPHGRRPVILATDAPVLVFHPYSKRVIEKFEKEAAEMNKRSFKYAWVRTRPGGDFRRRGFR